MRSSSPRSVCAECCSSSEVCSSKDDGSVSVFEMVGDESCPYEIA